MNKISNLKGLKYIFILLLCLFFSYSCHSTHHKNTQKSRQPTYPADTIPRYQISFKKVNSYGSTDKQYVDVGGPHHNMAEVDNKGRVYIPDQQQRTIFVFAPTGHIITHLGRQGRGPGEFIHVGSLELSSKFIYVYCYLLQRINVYSLDSLSRSHTILMNPSHWKSIKKYRICTRKLICIKC